MGFPPLPLKRLTDDAQTARPSSSKTRKEFVDRNHHDRGYCRSSGHARPPALGARHAHVCRRRRRRPHLRSRRGRGRGAGAELEGARDRARGGRGGARARPQHRHEPLYDRLVPDVPQRGRPLSAAHRGGGGRTGEAHRERRPRCEGADDQLQPPPRRLDRQALPDAGHHPGRPRPGGRPRPDSRRREVRLAQGLQVLHVRDLVDPAGGSAWRREQGAHDPHPGPRRRARAEGVARPARAGGDARARPDAGGDLRALEAAAQPRARGARRPLARSPRPTCPWATTATRRSAI